MTTRSSRCRRVGCSIVPSSSPKDQYLTFLLDPSDRSRVELPALDEDELPELCRCVLSDQSLEPGCGVLVFDLRSPAMLFCCIGGERWSKHDYDTSINLNELYVYDYYLREASCPEPKRKNLFDIAGVGGRSYFHVKNDVLGTLDFTGGGDGQEQPPEPVLGTISIRAADVSSRTTR